MASVTNSKTAPNAHPTNFRNDRRAFVTAGRAAVVATDMAALARLLGDA